MVYVSPQQRINNRDHIEYKLNMLKISYIKINVTNTLFNT